MQTIFAVEKQANKITEGLKTFYKCFLVKKKKKRNVKFTIPTKSLESFSQFLAFSINHLVCRAKNVFIWSSDRPEPELRDRCS